jgi:hypothetical protein
MPQVLITELREAMRRRVARTRYEAMHDTLMANGADWGLATEGTVPPSTATYRTVDKPARAHLQLLYQQSLGTQPLDAEERGAKHKALLQDIFTDNMN